MSSFKTNEILRKIEKSVRCTASNTGADGTGHIHVTNSDTQSSASVAQSATLASGTHAETLEMRAVEVLNSGGTAGQTLTVLITKADGSTVTATLYHTVQWGYEGLSTESPITDVLVTNNGAAALAIIINVVSRTV